MMKTMIRIALWMVNFWAIILLRLYFLFKKHDENGVNVVVLSDYLNTTLLLDSNELFDLNVWLITTKRYNFYNLLLNGRYKTLNGLHFVQDYADEQREALFKFCQEKNVQYAFLQSGDFMVPMVNYLNRKLNNGKGNSELAVRCSLDKSTMRDTLNKKNISVFKKCVINSLADLQHIDFYPCVLKPAIGTASEGIVLLENAKQAERAYQNALQKMRKTEFATSYIAEEFVKGRQFDVEGIVHNGRMYVLCIVEENYEGFFPNFDVNWFFFNASIESVLVEKMTDIVSSALNACEVLHGAFHCELRINAKEEVRILEFSNRMGGGFERPITELTGTNFCDVYVQSMLDKQIVVSNKQEMMLDKYFKDKAEYMRWKTYLDKHAINYSSHVLLLPNNKFKISIKTTDKSLIYRIADEFSLAIEKIN